MNFDPERDDELENADETNPEEERFLDESEATDESPEENADEDVGDETFEDELAPVGEPAGAVPPEGPPPSNFDLAYPQLFFFLFCSLAMTVGTLLPWERTSAKFNLTGADSIGGGLLLVLALYGVITGFFNIYHRKMIVWPVLLAAVEGAIIGWQRVVQILTSFDASPFITAEKDWQRAIQTIKAYIQSMGPGLYVVTIFSTLVLLSIILSVFKGAKEEGRRKSEERDARAEARRARKS
ncbi:MAG: hypothetical protein ABFS86_10705 [Planctomycetota bacterium]